MKILTWNINGIRGNKGLKLKDLLDSLDADIICLQETKVSREQLDESSAVVEGYNSYFSFSRARAGYSGVATFVRDGATPLRAEDGLSGLSTEQKDESSVGHYGDYSMFTDDELTALDREGRCVMTEHTIRDSLGVQRELVIINVYCPRADIENEERKSFKMRFYQLLQSRAEAILKSGRQVIVLGDINTSHKKLDHCDPANDEEFYANPGRKWMDNFLCDSALDNSSTASEGHATFTENHQFVDTFRMLHPDEQNAFTNWSTVTSARETNYGCRLDYIFANIFLARQFVKECFIMPEVYGSDHCPVKAVLDCEAMPARKCPLLCTKYMPQFSGKQQKLSAFLVKKTSNDQRTSTPSDSLENSQSSNGCDSESLSQGHSHEMKLSNEPNEANRLEKNSSQKTSETDMDSNVLEDGIVLNSLMPSSLLLSTKRSLSDSNKKNTSKKPKVESGGKQSNLLNFFDKRAVSQSCSEKCNKRQQDELLDNPKLPNETDNLGTSLKSCHTGDSGCLDGTRKLSSESDSMNNFAESVSNSSEVSCSSKATVWKNLLKGPGQAPLCKGHQEPCVLRTVKKSGPNRGKQFWTCNRPEGHKTNPDARCDYFVWVSNKKPK